MRGKLKIKECTEAPDYLEDEDGNFVTCPMGQYPNANQCRTSCAWFREEVEKDRPHFYCKDNPIGFGDVFQCVLDNYDEKNQ